MGEPFPIGSFTWEGAVKDMAEDLTEEVAKIKGLLIATQTRRSGDSLLSVYRSIQVREDGKLFTDVREKLRDNCHVVLENKREHNPTMVLRTAQLTSYWLYAKCPEDDCHECARPTLAFAGNRLYLLDRDGIRGSVHSYQVAIP